MIVIVTSALVLSIILYIGIGLYHKKGVNKLDDIIPVSFKGNAKVATSSEFSASTVATTISLATVVIAFFELAPGLGFWLFWPVVTTSLGLYFFSFLVPKIWNKLSTYDHRPSLHEYLGVEFNSNKVAFVGAIFTTLGYLSAFAVELTVGSRLFSALIPNVPELLVVIILSSIAFIYTSLGGFRTVVVTDKIQMYFIWALLFALLIYYGINYIAVENVTGLIEKIPESITKTKWDKALLPFIFGILIMNLFTYVSNMGLWQRIAGSHQPNIVIKGMKSSVYSSMLSWGLFVIVSIGAYTVLNPDTNIKQDGLLNSLLFSLEYTIVGKVVLFISILALYGAMLSTASTQLIAVSHTLYEDIIAPFRKIDLTIRMKSKYELKLSRILLLLATVLSILVVELLRIGGFTVADMAFSIYGAALCLVPIIIVSLYSEKEQLFKLKNWAVASVILGFTSAWISALYGKLIANGNLVFLAPCISIVTSSLIIFLGICFSKFVKK